MGGGFIIVPALKKFTDLPIKSIVATSLGVLTIISTSGVLFSNFYGAMNYQMDDSTQTVEIRPNQNNVGVIYTKECLKKNKFIRYYHFEESIIAIPYDAFFVLFIEKVEHFWRILKEIGLISDSWEKLEDAKKIVKDVRYRLDNNILLF